MNIRTLLLALGVCLFFPPKRAYSQIPGSIVYTEAHGYPAFSGYIIDQDSRGFIWVGTDQGAVRFDGAQFEVFDPSDGLLEKEVLHPMADQDSGVLLIPLLNNLAYYHNGSITNAEQDEGLALAQYGNQNRAQKDVATGSIWLGDTRNRQFLLRMQKGKIEKISLSIDREFELWGATNNQLLLRYTVTGDKAEQLILYNHDDQSIANIALENTGLHQKMAFTWGKQGEYIAATSTDKESVSIYSNNWKGSFTLRNHLYLGKQVTSCVIDSRNRLWILLRKGGLLYAGPIEQLKDETDLLLFLPDTRVNDVFLDRDENLWISTHLEGLHFISKKHWLNALATRKFLGNMPTPKTMVPFHKHAFLISGSDRNSLYNSANGSVIFSGKSGSSGFSKVLYFPKKQVVALADDISTQVLGLSQNNTARRIWSLKSAGSVKGLAQYDDESFILAFHNGVGRLYLDDEKNTDKDNFLFNERSTSVAVFADKTIAIGTPIGLHLSAPDSTDVTTAKPLQFEHISQILVVDDEHALIGTVGKGLFVFNKNTLSATQVSSSKELLSAYVCGMFRSSENTFWLATDKGIFRIDLDETLNPGEILHYTSIDGLPSNQVSSVMARNDTIFANTLKGFTVLPPENHPIDNPSKVWITKAQSGDTLIHFPKHIKIRPPFNHIGIELSAIAYGASQHEYAFRIKELDTNWSTSENPQINISYLQPGSYLFEARGGGKGQKQAKTQLHIQVLPLFWQTQWFKVVSLLFVLVTAWAGIYAWAKSYKRRIHAKAKERRRMAELELEAIKAQINPHFISNCLNSIQYFHLKNEHAKASEYLDLFAKLIHLTLKFSQESFVRFCEEKEYLDSYLRLEKMRFGKQMDYRIHIDHTIDAQCLIPALLIQPYLENALKHGMPKGAGQGHLLLEFRQLDTDCIKVLVKDNGPGIEQGSKASAYGLGLKLAANRARSYRQLFRLNIDIEIRDVSKKGADGTGTEILLTIPLIEHENPSSLQQLHR